MKQYDSYKDSGIKWLGVIPSHWELCKVKNHYSIITGFTPSTSNQSYYTEDEKYTWVTIADLKQRVICNSANHISELYVKEYKPQIVAKGSLMYSFKLSVGAVAFAGKDLYTNEAIASFEDNDDVDLSFLYYSAQYYIIKNANINIYGAPILNQDLIRNAYIVFPPLDEQRIIAAYLDDKVGQIDAVIAEKEAMVEELKNYRKSIILETITQGLNHEAPMKESGIPWIGLIPAHWSIIKLKHIALMQSGSNLTSEEIKVEGEYPVYGGNGLRGYYHEFSNEGDYVLIGRQGALCGNINYAKGKFWATEHAIVCYPKVEYALYWFGELLRSMNLNQYSESAAQPGLSVEKIKQLEIPYPPFIEQQGIANFLETKTKEIGESIEILCSQINDLRIYKTSLITEAVTGKIDLR